MSNILLSELSKDQLIEKFEDKWNWKNLSQNCSLTEHTIEKYKDKWNWYRISVNPSATPEILFFRINFHLQP